MYSGLLPKGLTEEDLSPDDEAEEDDVRCPLQPPGCSAEISTAENPSAHGSRDPQTADMPGISQEMWQVSALPPPRSNSEWFCCLLTSKHTRSCKTLKMFTLSFFFFF